jgi:hypothetical protein
VGDDEAVGEAGVVLGAYSGLLPCPARYAAGGCERYH